MNPELENYRLVTTWSQDDANKLAAAVLENQLDIDPVFRDNRATFCAAFHYANLRMVLKVPKARNARYGERILTLFRPSESFRIFNSHMQLQQHDFTVPTPVLAAEKRKWGVVTDSFVIYEYLDGDIADETNAQEVLHVLLQLHEMGYTRNDPKLPNFIIGETGVGLIDFKLKRPRFLARLRMNLELVRFLHSCRNVSLKVPDLVTGSLWFPVATWLNLKRKTLRKSRKKIKAVFK